MGRIRTIKPEFWKHEALSALPESTYLLAAALLNYSDDEGYFNSNPRLIQAECLPLREPSPPELGKEQGKGKELGRETECGSDKSDAQPKIEFDVFWKEYPTDQIMSKANASVQWTRLAEKDRRAAHAALTGFKAYCNQDKTYRPVHPEKFLRERRFDGFAESNVVDFDQEKYLEFCERAGREPKQSSGLQTKTH